MKRPAKLQWREDIRVLPAMPLHIWLPHRPPLVMLDRADDGYRFTCLVGPDTHQSLRDELIGKDVWIMRNEFWRIANPTEAFDFLSEYSPLLKRPTENEPWELTWADFQKWQRLLKEIALNGFPFIRLPEMSSEYPPAWFSPDIPLDSELLDLLFSPGLPDETAQWLRGNPCWVSITENGKAHMDRHPDDAKAECKVIVGTGLEAILATIYFSKVVGVKTKKCSQERCDNIFDITTSHEKNFCSPKCAHTQGTRVRRKLAKEKALHKGRRKTHGK